MMGASVTTEWGRTPRKVTGKAGDLTQAGDDRGGSLSRCEREASSEQKGREEMTATLFRLFTEGDLSCHLLFVAR